MVCAAQMLTARKGQRPSAWIDWSEARRVMVRLALRSTAGAFLFVVLRAVDYGWTLRQVNWEGYKMMILERFDSKYDCAV